MMSIKLAMVALGVFGVALQQQNAVFNSGGSRIFLRNYDQGTIDGIATGQKEKHAVVSGNLVELFSPEKGLTARAKNLDFTWAELDPKTMEIRKGQLEGNATLIIDGEVASQTQAEAAKAKNQPTPKPPQETSILQVDSELFSYAGTVDRGTLTMPGQWTLKQTAKGVQQQKKDKKVVQITYTQTFDANGSSGFINLIRGKGGVLNQPETGHLEGPVHFKVVRDEIADGETKSKITTYTGVADHVDINMLAHPGTITAEGHVSVDADVDGYVSHFSDDNFVFLVNEKFEPQGIKFWGKPGVTTAKSKGGSK